MGNPVARVGVDKVGNPITGANILGGGQSTVYCNGSLVAVIGDAVAGHGSGSHAAPTLAVGSTTVFAGGKGVCRQGDAASCGHTIGSGSPDTNAG